MGKYLFESPKLMIFAGLSVVIIGILLIKFIIGYLGIIVGSWWILKGIYWKLKLVNYNEQYLQSKLRVKELANQLDNAISSKNYDDAIKLAGKLSYFSILEKQYQMQFARDAALYSIFSKDFKSAIAWNNDKRFENNNDPDYANINSIILMSQGKVNEAIDVIHKNRHNENRGRYYEIASHIVVQLVEEIQNF